jgi:large subunit ribosomal protein L35
VTATGKVMRPARQAPRQIADDEADRQLRGTRVLFKTDGDNVKVFLPNA